MVKDRVTRRTGEPLDSRVAERCTVNDKFNRKCTVDFVRQSKYTSSTVTSTFHHLTRHVALLSRGKCRSENVANRKCSHSRFCGKLLVMHGQTDRIFLRIRMQRLQTIHWSAVDASIDVENSVIEDIFLVPVQ